MGRSFHLTAEHLHTDIGRRLLRSSVRITLESVSLTCCLVDPILLRGHSPLESQLGPVVSRIHSPIRQDSRDAVDWAEFRRVRRRALRKWQSRLPRWLFRGDVDLNQQRSVQSQDHPTRLPRLIGRRASQRMSLSDLLMAARMQQPRRGRSA